MRRANAAAQVGRERAAVQEVVVAVRHQADGIDAAGRSERMRRREERARYLVDPIAVVVDLALNPELRNEQTRIARAHVHAEPEVHLRLERRIASAAELAKGSGAADGLRQRAVPAVDTDDAFLGWEGEARRGVLHDRDPGARSDVIARLSVCGRHEAKSHHPCYGKCS